MKGLSGPQEAGAWRFRLYGVIAALAVILFAFVFLSPLSAELKVVATGIGLVGGALAMATGLWIRSGASTGRRQRAWRLLSIAGLLAAVSNLFLVTSSVRSTPPDRTASDLVLSLALIAGIAGVATFPQRKRRATDLARMILDGIVLGGSGLFIASVTLFPRILDEASGSDAFSLVVPVVDVVLATVATLLFLRGDSQDRPTLGLVAAGCGAYAFSDFMYAVRTSEQGIYVFGSAADLGWIAGYALIALAALRPARETMPPRAVDAEPSPMAGTATLFTLFLVAAVLSVWNLTKGTLTPASAVLWLLVLLAVLARQIMLIVDNLRLQHNLQRLVDVRTRSLRQVSQQSQLLVNSVGEGIYGVDRDGRVTFVNPAAARTLGYAPGDLIGKVAHEVFHHSQTDGTPYPAADCYITEAIRDRVATNAEEDNYRRADHRAFPVEVTATPLIEDDHAIGAVVVFRDVTQRREIDRMKTEFVSMVSHELRTPLAAIRGSLGLMSGGALGQLSPSASRMVDIALVSSDRLGRLINEILDIERIESGMLSMDLTIHESSYLVQAAVGQVQVLATEAGVSVDIGQVEGHVFADADRVVQTLLNLLGNSVKFSHHGGRVTVCAREVDRAVEFAISDDGRGIPEDKLDAIFSRFEQVDSSDAREKGGTGLGLFISRSIVEKLGGRIWATNNSTAGATFFFTLPSAAPVRPRREHHGANIATGYPSEVEAERAQVASTPARTGL